MSTSRICWCLSGDFPSHDCALGIIIILMPASESLSIIVWFSRKASVMMGLTNSIFVPVFTILAIAVSL